MVSTEEATLRRLLSNFVPPARAEDMAAAAAVAPGDPVVDTIERLRSEYGAGDEDLVFALSDAGLLGGRIAELTGLGMRTVNEWLDEEVAPLPPAVHVDEEPRVPRGLEAARRLVRTVWVVLLVAVVVLFLQLRGDDVDCDVDLCVTSVSVQQVDGTVTTAAEQAVYEPADVEAVQFAYSAPTTWEGEVRWSAEGVELAVTQVSVTGTGTLVVGPPAGPLPVGVHVVEVVGGPPEATIAFSVQR